MGHELFEVARQFVPESFETPTATARRARERETYDPLREDLRSEAVLALLEDRDPAEAVRRARSVELGWRLRLAPLSAHPHHDRPTGQAAA